LYVSRPAVVGPGELVEIHTDIRVALPPGYWAHLLGRSSTPRRYGLQVIEAVIDNGYRGEMFIAVRSFSERTIDIEPGMRLAQLIPHKIR
jgi:dUTP pyrophosphatase